MPPYVRTTSSVLGPAGPLGSFHFLAVMNRATVNTDEPVCLWRTSSPLGTQLDCMIKLLLASQATAILISQAAAPVCMPTALPAFVVIISFNFSYSDWRKMTLKVVSVSLMPKDDIGASIELKRLGRDLDQKERIQEKGGSTQEL